MSGSAFAPKASSEETAALDAAVSALKWLLIRAPSRCSSQRPHTVTLTSPRIWSRTETCSARPTHASAPRGLRGCSSAWLLATAQARCCDADACQRLVGARWKGSLAGPWLSASLTLSFQQWIGLWQQQHTDSELFVLICLEILRWRLQVQHVVSLYLPLQQESSEMSSYSHQASSCWLAQVASTAPRATLLALVSPFLALHSEPKLQVPPAWPTLSPPLRLIRMDACPKLFCCLPCCCTRPALPIDPNCHRAVAQHFLVPPHKCLLGCLSSLMHLCPP